MSHVALDFHFEMRYNTSMAARKKFPTLAHRFFHHALNAIQPEEPNIIRRNMVRHHMMDLPALTFRKLIGELDLEEHFDPVTNGGYFMTDDVVRKYQNLINEQHDEVPVIINDESKPW